MRRIAHSAMGTLLSHLPPRVVRTIGRAQFRIPVLRWLLQRANGALTNREGTIANGAGAGLRFDGSGGNPGYLLGTSEPEEQAWLAKHLSTGGILYDIGANIGFISTLAGRMAGEGGHVYAFEPFPSSASRARHNAALNDMTNVTVIEAAVADRAGIALLDIYDRSQHHRLTEHAVASAIQVDVIAIDDWKLRAAAPDPTVVLIDVEGTEIQVLRGMRACLSESRPIVLCEVHWLGRQFLDEFAAWIEPIGYVLSSLEHSSPPSDEVRWHAILTPSDVGQPMRRVRL